MTDQEKLPDTMALWNQVCETDPGITRHVSQRGGFTAIAAQSQIKTATRLWGPYGAAWGVRDMVWTYLRDAAGELIEVVLQAEFFYPGGAFVLATDMAFRKGNDTAKKLLTDLTTKALSKLGFNSDVFEGKFDDSKYVQDMRKKYGNGNGSAPAAPTEKLDRQVQAAMGKLHATCKQQPSYRLTLEQLTAHVKQQAESAGRAMDCAFVGECIERAQARIAPQNPVVDTTIPPDVDYDDVPADVAPPPPPVATAPLTLYEIQQELHKADAPTWNPVLKQYGFADVGTLLATLGQFADDAPRAKLCEAIKAAKELPQPSSEEPPPPQLTEPPEVQAPKTAAEIRSVLIGKAAKVWDPLLDAEGYTGGVRVLIPKLNGMSEPDLIDLGRAVHRIQKQLVGKG